MAALATGLILGWPVAGADAEVRTAKVAGQFYPEESVELLSLVKELLGRQPEPVLAKKPRILIVPHAGYQYSGLIAANAFRQLKGAHYDGVVVVGLTHRMSFEGASVDTRDAYLTPLGEIPIHQEAVAILQSFPGIGHIEEAHESGEHSLEVELPFLQVALGERWRLVPVLMGGVSLEEANQLAAALAVLARLGDYLFVFSSDLSHYHPYDQAEATDDRTINAILLETPQAVSRLFAQGQLEACGRGPIVTSLLLADRLGYLKRQLLYRANSADTWGTPERVVGYAAIGMVDRPLFRAGRLSAAEGEVLTRMARQALERVAQGGTGKPAIPAGLKGELARARGVFVTLRKGGALRGCVGRVRTNQPLAQSVQDSAVDAALHDPRFTPVTAAELPAIQLEVSVLTDPVPLNDPEELVPGRDGVILAAEGRSGVFLPQVWSETGFTRVEFLRALASEKAGLPPDAWEHAALSVFQAQVFEEAASRR